MTITVQRRPGIAPGRPAAGGEARVHRARLDNGLRVVLLPDPQATAVGIAVAYDVGYRTEARSGFAHLFEHMMFQGSPNVPAQEHGRRVQANGGAFNGTTYRDHTSYYEVLPAEALELGLFLEADRMRGVLITPESLARQVAVVTEEINRSIRNRPYGGFPTFQLPAVAFDDYANAHDGFGDTESLAAATVPECEEFFDAYYAPGNAVLGLSGRFRVDEALDLVERHFGAVPARSVPVAAEPVVPVLRDRRRVVADRLAPLPALAMGWAMPDTADPSYLAAVVLAAVLAAGDTSRLKAHLVRDGGVATQVLAGAGLTGPFEARTPDLFTVNAVGTSGTDLDGLTERIRAELGTVADGGIEPAELRRAVRWLQAMWYRDIDSVGSRANRLSRYELLHGAAELTTDVPRRLNDMDAETVWAVARRFAAAPVATLHLTPGGAAR